VAASPAHYTNPSGYAVGRYAHWKHTDRPVATPLVAAACLVDTYYSALALSSDRHTLQAGDICPVCAAAARWDEQQMAVVAQVGGKYLVSAAAARLEE
jgi:hypothetical protein